MAHESPQEMGFATHIVNQMPSFESNPELFNLTTGMEMLAFPSKNQDGNNNSVMWKGFFSKQGNHQGFSSSSSKTINEHGTTYFYQTDFNKPDFSSGFSETSTENLIVAPDSSWQDNNNRLVVDDSSFRCVFPCEGGERPSQGLSLSLSSKKPSTIGLQSFELRETSLPTHHHHHHHHQQQDGFFGKSENFQNHDGFFGKASYLHQNHFHLKNSKYLGPAQELLNEFCNLGIKQSSDPQKQKLLHKMNQWEDENGTGSSSKQSPLNSLDLLELQKRKVKLLSMLEEVDRRYRQYHDQMKAVVSSFEGVIGIGAASIYSALASKAMSRHFRCLRDGIMAQIKATKKSMGEKDPVAPGTTKGETPRLRLLEQTLRQQRAFQQMSMMESHPWRPQRGLPERSVSVLRAWLFEHFLHPYPSDVDKHILSRQTGLSRSQVSNWFINARVRLWKPMVEEMYLEETKEQDNIASSDGITDIDHQDNSRPNQNNTPNRNLPHTRSEDQKPTPDQLVHSYSESLSSIINSNPDKTDMKNVRNHQQQQLHRRQFGRVPETFGAIDLDFSSYNDQTSNTVSYSADNAHHQNFGTGVSLTLGLQQHVGTSMNLSFSPPSQHSLFYPSDHIEDCEQDEYPILNGEARNLPYRNLMGAQLLHDLAG